MGKKNKRRVEVFTRVFLLNNGESLKVHMHMRKNKEAFLSSGHTVLYCTNHLRGSAISRIGLVLSAELSYGTR